MMELLQIITPLLLASIGGLYTEYSGSTNIALEGYMTMGAFIFAAVTVTTGSITTGIIATLIIIMVLSFLQSSLTIKLKANPIITGLAVNMAFFGIIPAVEYKLFNTKGVITLPVTGELNTTLLTVLALIIPFITIVIMNYTTYGLRLKVRGMSKKSLLYTNIDPEIYRITSVMISAVLASLGGIFLAMELRSFIPNISAGRGWISMVIIFLGRKRPIGIVIGCFIFSLSLMISNLSQSQAIPTDIILASPYILTLIALILTSRSKNNP